jgi:hypothetical protein
MSTSSPNTLSGKRMTTRRKSLLGGRVVYGKGAYTVQCAVHNLSEAGARIKTARSVAFPKAIYLIEIKSGIAYAANVVWGRPSEFGLSFLTKYHLDDLPPEIDYLRPIWVEASVR